MFYLRLQTQKSVKAADTICKMITSNISSLLFSRILLNASFCQQYLHAIRHSDQLLLNDNLHSIILPTKDK